MTLSSKLDQIHAIVKQNRWMRYFTVFCRIALAAGFIPAGMVKILGERFTDLHNNQPMGHYLEALFHTGYYYTFIGIVQVIAAICLLIPPMATIGAILYFPVILNICLLSLSVRFDGSLLTSPWMTLACLYLLCWDYDKFKLIFPFNRAAMPKQPILSNKFPAKFFAGCFVIVVGLGFLLTNIYTLRPRNTIEDCITQCKGSANPKACIEFCNDIHAKGEPLNKSLDKYENAVNKGQKGKP